MFLIRSWARRLRVLLALCALVPTLTSASICVTCGGGGGGNPPPAHGDARILWVAMPENVLKLSPQDGSVGLELDETPQPQGFAVDQTNDSVWIYGHKRLQGFDSKGHPLVSVHLPHDFDDDVPAGMAVDNDAGNLWLAMHRHLYRLDLAGHVQATVLLAEEVEGISLDIQQAQLWVAEEHGIEIFDRSGNRVAALDLGRFHPEAVAYDADLKQAWLLSDERLERVDASGNVVLQVKLAEGLDKFLAPDGQGGLWVAGKSKLGHLDVTGITQFTTRPFDAEDHDHQHGSDHGHEVHDGEGDDEDHSRIVDLVADPLDHSAWVADAATLKHFGGDGSLKLTVAVPTPAHDTDNNAAHDRDEDEDHHGDEDHGDDHDRIDVKRLALYVDTIPPTVSISSPPDFIYTNNNRPVLSLDYSDIGSGVDPASVAVTANGITLPETCLARADGTGANCTPNAALSDGGYTLAVTVKDYAGNLSQPASLTLTIDTAPPSITVTSAVFSNVPAYTLTGSLSEAGSLSVNGLPELLDPSTDAFSVPLTLNPGSNNLDLVATDLAGNVTEETVVITYNTTPVNTPAGDLIAFAPGGGTTQTLVCQPGAATAGSMAVLTDINTGVAASVIVKQDGSCSVSMAGAATDNYSLLLTTLTGNQSQTVYLHANDAVLQFLVTSPVTGTTINSNVINVTGTYAGPANMGITVNGQPAILVDGQFSVNGVTLAPGTNTLTVNATSVGGLTASQTLAVTSGGASQLTLTATAQQATQGPLSVTFQYQFSGSFEVQSLAMSYLGNGSNDTVISYPTGLIPLSYTYTAPGVYPATLTITDINGVQYQAQVDIVVQDAAQMDAAIRTTWSDMTTALSNGNKAAAMFGLDYTAQQNYGPVFDALLPHMSTITGNFSPLMQSSLSGSIAEYAVVRVIGGQPNLFFVDFIRDINGVWRLDAM